MDSAFKKKFSMASKTWQNAKKRAVEEGGYSSEVEDGVYLAAVNEAKIGESQSSGRLQIAWDYTIVGGEFEGQHVRNYDGLETEENQVWLARKLAKLGYDVPDDLEEIEVILKEITQRKPTVQIQVKTKGEYQNVYIQKLAEAGEETETVSQDEEPADDGEVEGEEVGSADSSGEVELEVGMTVTATLASGNGVEGTVVKIEEEQGKVLVRTSAGKLFRVNLEKIESATAAEETKADEEEVEEDVEEVPETPKKVVKKSPSKPVKSAPKKKSKR